MKKLLTILKNILEKFSTEFLIIEKGNNFSFFLENVLKIKKEKINVE